MWWNYDRQFLHEWGFLDGLFCESYKQNIGGQDMNAHNLRV